MLPLVLAVLPLLAQSVPRSQNDELVRASKNPYDLARFIDSHLGFDWNVLWKALGTEGASIQPCGKLSDGKGGCSSELITVLNPDQTIVLVKGDFTPADVYIRFMHEKNGSFKFSGMQGAEIHNYPRRHEVDRSTGVPFLRISVQGLRGSDIGSEIENWYDLTRSEFEPVFSFTVHGSQRRLMFGMSREISTVIIPNRDSIDVVLEVTLSGEDHRGSYSLGTLEVVGVYKRAASGAAFALQEAFSDMPRKLKMSVTDFISLADLSEGPSNEDLIRLDVYELKEIATGTDLSAKACLKELLKRCKDTPEVRQLKSLLR
jgi:hypothetical protein